MSTSSPEPRRVVPPITRTARIAFRMIFATLIGLSTMLAACSAIDSEVSSDTTWVGTITTEGNVTTVVNESGSVWGGTATLVEEASIGVEAGPEEYMLGSPQHVAASADRIYVIDASVPIVRIYDYDGLHVGDLGAGGEGPGEFGAPESIAVISDGRVFVRDRRPARLTVFMPDGTVQATFRMGTRVLTPKPMVVTPDGTPYVPDEVHDEAGATVMGMVPHSPEGPGSNPLVPPDFDYQSQQLEARGSSGRVMTSSPVPFAPTITWAMASSGAMIAGLPSAYRFEVHGADGHVLVVESRNEAVPVAAEEAEWHRRRLTAWFRRGHPEWSWNGPAIPAVKPAYRSFIPSHSGEVWVLKPGPATPVDECTEDPQPRQPVTPCWIERDRLDVFGPDGRYLGPVDVPDGVRLSARSWISGGTVITAVEDAAGTPMVKRYRLVLPGEEGR